MLKTLIKKEFAGFFGNMLNGRKKKGKKTMTITGLILLLVLIFVSFCTMFFGIFLLIGEKISQTDYTWFYGAFTLLIATVLSLIGSIFSTQTQLYGATDNDLLLSLPIPPSYILLARMIPLYLCNLFFVATVSVPAFIVYTLYFKHGFLSVLFWILDVVSVSFLGLAICCFIGRLTAKITQKYKSNSILAIIVTIIFFGVYMLFVTYMNEITRVIIDNAGVISSVFKKYLPTVYWAGLSTEGNALWFVVTFLINALVCFAIFLLLSKTYISIVTENKSFVKRSKRIKPVKTKSVFSTLLNKEFLRFIGSPVYFVNCVFGAILLIVATVLIVIKSADVIALTSVLGEYYTLLPVILMVCASLLSVQDCVSACSVSLEGSSLWILQSLPVKPSDVLLAKLTLHTLVTAPFALVFIIVSTVVLAINPVYSALIAIAVVATIFISGAFGLKRNLLNPDLRWTNESQPVKQSFTAFLSLLFGFIISLAVSAATYGLGLIMPLYASLAIIIVLLLLVAFLYLRWFNKKGSDVFANL